MYTIFNSATGIDYLLNLNYVRKEYKNYGNQFTYDKRNCFRNKININEMQKP